MIATQPGLKTMIQQSERFFEDDEESFKDIEESDDEKDKPEPKKIEKLIEKRVVPKISDNGYTDYLGYDPYKREPKFSGCGESCFWELSTLMKHNHPTVKKFSEILLT